MPAPGSSSTIGTSPMATQTVAHNAGSEPEHDGIHPENTGCEAAARLPLQHGHAEKDQHHALHGWTAEHAIALSDDDDTENDRPAAIGTDTVDTVISQSQREVQQHCPVERDAPPPGRDGELAATIKPHDTRERKERKQQPSANGVPQKPKNGAGTGDGGGDIGSLMAVSRATSVAWDQPGFNNDL